jgi:23S rRNA-/tRNA-specific pseudouridylate synthase
MKATSSEEGRMAVSIFEVEEYLKGASLVRVRILTGRTHQIGFIWHLQGILLL